MALSRPPKKICTLPPIRVDEDLYRALETLAMAEGRWVSDYIRRILERHCHSRSISVRDEWAPSQFDHDGQ